MEKEVETKNAEKAEKADWSFLKIHPNDNVLVALKDLPAGSPVLSNGYSFELVDDVKAKHKFFLQDMHRDDDVIMYGALVGKVQCDVYKGQAMSTHNTKHAAEKYGYRSNQYSWKPPDISKFTDKTFNGYKRNDGRVGIANYWLFIPTVFCENRNLDVIKEAMWNELGYAVTDRYKSFTRQLFEAYKTGGDIDKINLNPVNGNHKERFFKNVDGIKFLIHEGGCGGTREDSQNLCALLAGYIHHPNVAGATVLSLGCQHAQVAILQEEIQRRDANFRKPLLVFEQQNSASEAAMLSGAIRETFLGLVEADKAERRPAPLSQLCLGLKCGGSDGFSGISANPAIGHAADLVAALGGKGILSEFPELCGVEQELINRCVSKSVAERFMQLMRDYAARAKAVRSGFEMNPSPGNIRDGLLTDAMKSAGAAKKGGTSPVTGVLDYPEYSSEPGLNLQCTPGSDVECVTAQVSAGANVVLFTTGLGTPTGNPIAPVIKLSTNSDLARRMPDIIDIDTGGIISGDTTIERMGEEILQRVIQVASGEMRTKAELLAQNDFIPWKRGVSL